MYIFMEHEQACLFVALTQTNNILSVDWMPKQREQLEMEDEASKYGGHQLASNLKVDLAQATSDRSLLDCSFLTAYEENMDEMGAPNASSAIYKIKSQALVDSNNEESSDGEGYAADSMTTKFTIGNDDHDDANDRNDNIDER